MSQKNATRTVLFALGFLSIGTQIYLVREFMMVFNDNELIIGIVLAIWMLITGIGSYVGRFSRILQGKAGVLLFLLMIAGILPAFMVAGLDVLKVFLVPYGSMAGLWQVLSACILVQLPFCLLNGFLFTFLSTLSPGNSPGQAYSWESMGSTASGVLVNFLFLWFLGPFQGLLLLTGSYLVLLLIFTRYSATKWQFIKVLAISLVFILFLASIDFRSLTHKMLFPSQQVVSDAETPYGQVVVTWNANQFNFFENGMLLFSSGNEISNEENVHYAMVQHDNPRSVLLISGGYSGTLSEIQKYSPDLIDYVELDPSLIGIAKKFTNQLFHSSTRIYEMDPRRYVRNSHQQYDVVLVNLPGPSSLQLNRCYTLEFIRQVRDKLRPGAIVAYSLPTGGDYVSEKAGRLNAILWYTLKQCFRNVLIIPAGRNYFLASDSILSLDIPGLIDARRINTTYVNRYYIDYSQLKERSAYVSGSTVSFITPSGSGTPSGWDTPSGSYTPSGSETLTGWINRDFTPVAVWYQMSWRLSQYKSSPSVILPALAIMLILLILTLNPVNAGLFAGGFTLAATEIILIFGIQVLCGYLFQTIGAIIMIFMLGLAAGSGLKIEMPPGRRIIIYRRLQVILACIACSIPLVLQWMHYIEPPDWFINTGLGLLAFSASFVAGMEYSLACKLHDKSISKAISGNYSAELWGSAAGAFAATMFLIPTIGIVYTGIILALLNLATAGLLYALRGKVL